METSKNELAKALFLAQSQIKHAKMDGNNPHFRSDYSTLADIWDAARVPLTLNGLSVVQTQRIEGETIISVTTLLHASGQSMVSELPLIMAKRDMQQLGSALTYARRYQLAAIAGISSDDDDGETCMDRPTVTKKSTVKPAEAVKKGLQPLSQEADVPNFDLQPVYIQTPNDDYTINFGKYNGKKLSEVPTPELRGYASFLKQKAADEGKQIGGIVEDFITRVSKL